MKLIDYYYNLNIDNRISWVMKITLPFEKLVASIDYHNGINIDDEDRL